MAEVLAIGIEPGLSVSMGALIGMLRYARRTTLDAVDGLTPAQLDHRHDAGSNSIGALLMHVAAVERWYQTKTFEGRDWNDDELAEWEPATDFLPVLRERIAGQPLDFYLHTLATVRARTEHELRLRDEEWLLRMEPFGKTSANNFWMWFHVCEDEINHRGQIRWLRKRL